MTGSRIRRPNVNSPVPVVSLSGEEFFQQGQNNIGDTLNDLMEQDTALGFQLMKQLNLLVTGTLTAFAAG